MEKIENAKIEDLREGDIVDFLGCAVDYTGEDNDIFLEDGGWIGKKSFKSLTIHRQTKEEKEIEELKAMAEKLGYSIVPKYQGDPNKETLYGNLAALEREGWVLWNGGYKSPITNDYEVDLKFKDGSSARGDWPSDWNWQEVIAYRVVEESK